MRMIKDICELDKWLDNMRDAMVAQIQRGAEVKVENHSGPTPGTSGSRSAIWRLRVDGVRDEQGNLTNELVCLS